MAVTTYKWSIEEWHELVDLGAVAGKPVELLNGEITVRWSAPTAPLANPQSGLSPEGIEHSYSNQSIADYLRRLLQDRAGKKLKLSLELDPKLIILKVAGKNIIRAIA